MAKSKNSEFVTAYKMASEAGTFVNRSQNQQPALQGGPILASADASNVSARPSYSRAVYEAYRPGEAIPYPKTQEEFRIVMNMCKYAYDTVGVIRSVIDMMSEFAVSGLEIVHPDVGPNAWYQAWSRRVDLVDRAERAINWAYKSGQFVIRGKYGTLTNAEIRQMKVMAAVDVKPGYVPLEYILFDPATIELVGGEFGAVAENKLFALRVPFNNNTQLSPKNELEKKVFDSIPPDIKNAIQNKMVQNGVMLIPLDPDKTYVGYYKKDDTDMWAKSFIYSILPDVLYNQKLKLAKTSGLDGYYNSIRVWGIGDHTQTPPIVPPPEAFSKLAGILANSVGGGTADIVWSSDLKVQELYPPVEKIANFQEDIHNILLGLGVPEGLVGGKAEGSAGMTSNYLGLKNMSKRLEAGRRMIVEWLNHEIDIIQKNMGFRKRPIIRFAHSDLYDEKTYTNLMIQLLDRNIISDETVLERFGESKEVEEARIEREQAQRDAGTLPKKAGPFFKPDLEQQQKHEINKIKMQSKVNQENNSPDNSSNVNKRINKVKRPSGRPGGSNDKVKRTRRPNSIKSPRASLILEASRVYEFVESTLKDAILKKYNVNNLRQLTAEQVEELDKAKLIVFPNIVPFSDLNENTVFEALDRADGPIEDFNALYYQSLSDVSDVTPTADHKKLLRIDAYADSWIDDLDD